MSDIKQRARDALNKASGMPNHFDRATAKNNIAMRALCREIEAHDATKAELAELREAFVAWHQAENPSAAETALLRLCRMTMPEPAPVDPLVEAIREATPQTSDAAVNQVAANIRSALAKRGLTITEGDAK